MVNEMVSEIFEMLGGVSDYRTQALKLLVAGDSKYLRDLKLNLKTVLNSDFITAKERALLGVAIAANDKNNTLLDCFVSLSQVQNATKEEIGEAVACSSLLSCTNVFYKFRHFAENPKYQKMPARLYMNVKQTPILGKEFFELISVAISAVNGCELCVHSHEKSLIGLGTSEDRILDAVRMASVLTSLSKIIG